MKRQLILLAFSAPLLAFAQLAPDTSAPLAAHMLEVNAEWRSFDVPLAATPVRFNNEAERIARHLHLVKAHLAAHTPEGLSAEQAAQRADLLNALEEYADVGQFPQNHILPYRNPIFIDPSGTACAVGQLMIVSGHRELAERIDAAMETSYLAEIIADERFAGPVSAWAGTHGFDAHELAWIQPGYPPPILWAPLGGGTNGTVEVALPLFNNDLLVVGSFTDAGDVACQGAARWNGTAYTAMGQLPEGVVHCAVEHGGELYIGGSFNNGQTDLLRWTGDAWVGEAVFASKWAEVTALLSHEGQLYAAGGESGFAGVDYGVKVLQEGNWLPLPGVLNGPIHALEFHENYLVAGGAFTGAFLSTQNEIMHVARYMDIGWVQIADGLDGDVHDLMVHGNALFATGDMVSMIGTSFGLASIENDLAEWTQLMPNITNYISVSPVDAPSVARRMVVHQDRIFIAGDIHSYTGLTYGRGVVAYNGAPDDVEPFCDFLGPANDIALVNGNQLVVGGASEFFHNIISTELATSIGPDSGTLELRFFPNPTVDRVSITLPTSMGPAKSVRVTDASGRLVGADTRPATGLIELDVRALAAGSYQVEVNDDSRTAIGRFVKQ
ncbi:MAG TPA: T9SS type A sorting domain-containing protein [Flavobacteriales bacterium]|nr:T9SS type A sorting domain-containing protein [Flavobacteriales bacterium]